MEYLSWGVPILIGIFVCRQTEKKRWLKTFIIGLVYVFVSKTFTDIYNYNEVNRYVEVLAESLGQVLITATIGYFVGNSFYSMKDNRNKKLLN
ncbi:MAG: hypothetical protein AB9846_02775 [Tenuifilaceae bacterium]